MPSDGPCSSWAETDFVAKNAEFQGWPRTRSRPAAGQGHHGRGCPSARCVGQRREAGHSGGQDLRELEVAAAAYFDGQTAVYLHKRASDLPPQVGVLVEYEGSDESAARGAAMQIAAMRPQYLDRGDVPADLVENERRIAEATAKEQGKPEQAWSKIIEGRVNAYFKDVVLLDQPRSQIRPRSARDRAAGVKVSGSSGSSAGDE